MRYFIPVYWINSSYIIKKIEKVSDLSESPKNKYDFDHKVDKLLNYFCVNININ